MEYVKEEELLLEKFKNIPLELENDRIERFEVFFNAVKHLDSKLIAEAIETWNYILLRQKES